MKTKIIALTIAMFVAGTFVTASVHSRVTALQTAQKTTDWSAYKKEQEEKIKKNEERIAELKKAKASTNKTIDDIYNKQIDKLQQKNTELRTKIVTYKYDKSKWKQFKREFNHDMDELGKALKDIGKDNVK